MDQRRPRRARPTKGMSPAASRWRALITDWSRSGQTQRAYCLRMKISTGTFSWWKHRLAGVSPGRAPADRRASTSPRFVRVEMLPSNQSGSDQSRTVVSAGASRPSTPAGSVPLEILLPGDIRIRVGVECDAAILRRVLAALRGAGC